MGTCVIYFVQLFSLTIVSTEVVKERGREVDRSEHEKQNDKSWRLQINKKKEFRMSSHNTEV